MVLFGLDEYIAASHELESDSTVDVLVNGRSVGQRHFTSADAMSGASLTIDVDAAHLQPGGNSVQVVRRSGSGRVYWSARGAYYSTEKKDFQSGTLSLNLTRDYYKLQPAQKDGKIIYTLQPLSGTAQVGDVLAVHEAINGSPMRYLLLEDPIPAGTEFVTSEGSYPIDHRPGGWYDWYTRREFHDDHAAFFASDFTGRQEIFYMIRVVNPGTFQISPARVGPMYQPERSGNQRCTAVGGTRSCRGYAMNPHSSSVLRSAFALMSVWLMLQQIGLAVLVFMLYVLWLRVPDASVLDVTGSVCLALIVIFVAGAGESALILRLANRPQTLGRLLRGTLLLLAAAALSLGWVALLGHFRGDYNSNDNLWAGYLNSRFPHQMRNVFTYQHILLWLGWMWTALQWVGAGIVAAFVFGGTGSQRPIRAAVRSLRSIAYWCFAVLVATAASVFSGTVLGWTPGHGLRIEMTSLVLRLTAVVLVDAVVVCFGLAMLATFARQSDEPDLAHSTVEGTPDDSQPRTAEAP